MKIFFNFNNDFKRKTLRQAALIIPFLFFFSFLLYAAFERLYYVYLEDDLVWFLPLVSQVIERLSPWNAIKAFHSGELSLTDGMYFTFLLSVFRDHLQYYNIPSMIFHVINTLLFYSLLKNRLRVMRQVSLVAALMHLTLYAHFHGYLWSLTAHHLFVIFFLLVTLHFYLKVDRLIEEGKPCTVLYWTTIVISLIASFSRLSILIIPLVLFVHILFTTKDNKVLLRKYDLWLPLFIVFPVYQLVSFVYGGYGNILSRFLKPFRGLILDCQNITVVVLAVMISASIFLALRAFLRVFLRKKPSDVLFIFIGYASLIMLLTIKTLVLCLYTFLWPFRSALFDSAILRFQSLFLPPPGIELLFWYAGTLIIAVSFLWYMIKKNRHLIIFVPWYLAVLSYLREYADFTFSRYLVYISPLFCLMFALFFMEILPTFFSAKRLKQYVAAFSAFLVVVVMLNISAIKIRSIRTMLVDNHWSYDYIKIAHVIKDDLLSRSVGSHPSDLSLCISGIKHIPYKRTWESGFLKNFDFEKQDPFRKIFTSVLNRPEAKVFVNEACPDKSLVYHVNDFTVADKDGTSVEPFYKSFGEGLVALKKGHLLKARISLEEAFARKPFLINFTLGFNLPNNKISDLFTYGVADTIYKLYAHFYEAEEKMDYIDNMIQTEAKDYGVALGLLAYLKNREGNVNEVSSLLHLCSLFIDRKSISEHYANKYFASLSARDFYIFLDQNKEFFNVIHRSQPCIGVETYKGFDISWYANYYFGLAKEEGPFYIEKYKGKHYKKCFIAATKNEIRRHIDAQQATELSTSKDFLDEKFQMKLSYRGSEILKKGDIYTCRLFLNTEDKGQKKNQFEFKARSFREIELVIDTFLIMEMQ